MKNKGLLIVLLAIAILIAGYYMWLKTHQRKVHENEKIKIGVILPLTGDGAEYGVDQRNGIILAKNHFGKKVEVFIEDSKSNSTNGINAYQKLKSHGVDIYVSTLSSVSNSIVPLIQKEGKLLFTIAADVKLTENFDNVIRMLPTSEYYATELAKYIITEKKISELGIIYANDDFGISLMKSFNDVCLKNNLNLRVKEGYEKGDDISNTLIHKVIEKKLNALFVVGYGSDLGLTIKKLREQGYNKTIYSTPEVSYSEVRQIVRNIYNIKYITMEIDTLSNKYINFKKDYLTLFNKTPSLDSNLSYDEIEIISQLDKNKPLKSQINKLLTDYKSITGRLKIDSKGNVLFPLSVKELK